LSPPFSQFNDPNDPNIPPRQISRGGQFLDGREATLELQAQQPFLNTLEMILTDKAAVVAVLSNSSYLDDFKDAYGEQILEDVDETYENISEAIATFERSKAISPFSSKFDAVKKGQEVFTTEEANGEQVYRDTKCGRCHTNDGPSPLFTNFEYENIGVPGNPNNPFLTLDFSLNPEGMNFVDFGLGGVTDEPFDDGKFCTPTLRNIESTGPYMHNGVFTTLEEVVDFLQ
jgi:cytochrome c peroxidase